MNKKEKDLTQKLYWFMMNREMDNHDLYCSKEILKSIIRGEYGLAQNLLDVFDKPIIVSTRVSEEVE